MKLYQAIADGLLAEGCDRAFGLMGDGNMPLWAAMVDRGVQMVSTRHEATAVGMADGYHRATGKVGVATVTWGPGLTQAMTQMLTAARHGSAVVVLTGLMPKGSRDVHQFVDHDRIAALAEMEHHVISSADDAAAQMAEAMRAGLFEVDCDFYLAGPPAFVDGLGGALQRAGVPPRQLRSLVT